LDGRVAVRFKQRVLASSILLVWVPLLVLAFTIRREMANRLTDEHTRRMETLVMILEADIGERTEEIRSRLDDLKNEIKGDNQFRLLAVEGLSVQRTYLLNYAERAMGLLGLSMLQIQDEEGRILSSGHFRNEFDRVEPDLPRLLAASPPGYALVQARKPEGSMLALACVDSIQLGNETFTLVGGVGVESGFLSSLAPDSMLAVSLIYPAGAVSSHERIEEYLNRAVSREGWTWEQSFPEYRYLVRSSTVPFAEGEAGLSSATLLASYPLTPLRQLLRSLDIWLGAVLVVTVIGTLVLSLWLSGRMSRPLVELAEKTSRIDFNRLDADFASSRKDEVGDLSRFLASMTGRLKTGARKLREAERRAALGELARQVNHDVRNGLTPIRNVFRHLSQVAKQDPEKLETVFREREAVLDSSIGYLEGLADNYSRLYRQNPKQPCDLNAVVRDLASARGSASGVRVNTQLASSLLPVLADPIALRRIVDNLVANAEDSLEEGGTITLITEPSRDEDGRSMVSLVVADTGTGISKEMQERIFDDFYTTKDRGAGLGLSIVRRMIADAGGSIRVESEVGQGAQFMVQLPAVGPDPGDVSGVLQGDK
jgi:signal transduction histidine kinase